MQWFQLLRSQNFPLHTKQIARASDSPFTSSPFTAALQCGGSHGILIVLPASKSANHLKLKLRTLAYIIYIFEINIPWLPPHWFSRVNHLSPSWSYEPDILLLHWSYSFPQASCNNLAVHPANHIHATHIAHLLHKNWKWLSYFECTEYRMMYIEATEEITSCH